MMRRRRFLLLFATTLLTACAAAPPVKELRFCADPNNLPYSNQAQQGFENRIAQIVGDEMHARVTYTWWAQRRGFIRSTLKAGKCDVIAGIPATVDMVFATEPYYRSTYVWLSRKDRHLDIKNFDDPVLRDLRIGIPLIGDDGASVPPAEALARRGYANHIVGFSVYGDYSKPNPPAEIVNAVADGRVDVAVVWGPLAGYFARQQNVPLVMKPVSPQIELPFLPMVFDISMGVRRGDTTFHRELNEILVKRKADINRILDEYGVPRLALRGGVS